MALCANMNSNAVQEILPTLFKASEVGQPWQARATALNAIASFGDHAPEQLGFLLPLVVPAVSLSMSEPKKEVSKAAYEAMTNACNVIGNKDIEHMTGKIIRSISHPEEVPEIMHALAGVTFVQSVQSPALAMVVPLLIRGLRSKVTATRRQSAVIIDNMSKLVDDPIDAEPFLPDLMPVLKFSAENMSDPEARGISERASTQLEKLSEQCNEAKKLSKEVQKPLVLAAIQVYTYVCCTHASHILCTLHYTPYTIYPIYLTPYTSYTLHYTLYTLYTLRYTPYTSSRQSSKSKMLPWKSIIWRTYAACSCT